MPTSRWIRTSGIAALRAPGPTLVERTTPGGAHWPGRLETVESLLPRCCFRCQVAEPVAQR
jgi:hypothetical protein